MRYILGNNTKLSVLKIECEKPPINLLSICVILIIVTSCAMLLSMLFISKQIGNIDFENEFQSTILYAAYIRTKGMIITGVGIICAPCIYTIASIIVNTVKIWMIYRSVVFKYREFDTDVFTIHHNMNSGDKYIIIDINRHVFIFLEYSIYAVEILLDSKKCSLSKTASE
jgi:hypothetical protein